MKRGVKILVDICMLILFILLLITPSINIAIYKILGTIMIFLAISHIVPKLDMGKNIFKNLIHGKLNKKSRTVLIYVIGLFVSIVTVIITGLLMSQEASGNINLVIQSLHSIFVKIFLIFAILHIRIHWKYIKPFFKREHAHSDNIWQGTDNEYSASLKLPLRSNKSNCKGGSMKKLYEKLFKALKLIHLTWDAVQLVAILTIMILAIFKPWKRNYNVRRVQL